MNHYSLNKILIVSVWVLLFLTNCRYDLVESVNRKIIKDLKISSINNITIEANKNSQIENVLDSYVTELTLLNRSEDTFDVKSIRNILPHFSPAWKKSGQTEFLNYSFFSNHDRFQTIKLQPNDSITFLMKMQEMVILDSIQYRPELILNNRRYRLEYMFRKNDDGNGYYLKDSISPAIMMKDTITDYSNYNIGTE